MDHLCLKLEIELTVYLSPTQTFSQIFLFIWESMPLKLVRGPKSWTLSCLTSLEICIFILGISIQHLLFLNGIS
jgi:hypothetical protein